MSTIAIAALVIEVVALTALMLVTNWQRRLLKLRADINDRMVGHFDDLVKSSLDCREGWDESNHIVGWLIEAVRTAAPNEATSIIEEFYRIQDAWKKEDEDDSV